MLRTGGIHPRSKYYVGRRLAVAASSLVYGANGPVTGPVLAGCSAEGKTVTVRFNSTLLAGETVVVGDYNATAGLSGAAVLTNASLFCMEPFIRCVMNESTGNCTHVREWYCPESTSDLEALRMHNQILDEIERLGGRYQLPRRCRSIPT